MADVINKNELVQLEFCLDKYLDEHYVPIIDTTYTDLSKKQSKEMADYLYANRYNTISGSGYGSGLVALGQVQMVQRTGEWNSKTMDDLVKMCTEKTFSNETVVRDLSFLTNTYRQLFIAQIGKEKYDALSEQGDLAELYVQGRLRDKFIDRVSDKNMPKSSMDYILHRAFDTSFLTSSMVNFKTSAFDNYVKEAVETKYDASFIEKASGTVLGYTIDALALKGAGLATVTGSIAIDATFDGGVKLYEAMQDKENIKNLDPLISEELFGKKNILSQIQQEAKGVDPSSSKFVSIVNDGLESHLRVKSYSIPFDPSHRTELYNDLKTIREASEGEAFTSNVATTLEGIAVKINRQATIPSFMLAKEHSEAKDQSLHFFATALEMQRCGKKEIMLGNTKMSLAEVAQRAYDYSRATDQLQVKEVSRTEAAVQEQSQTVSQQPVQAPSYQPQNAAYVAQQRPPQPMQPVQQALPTYQQLNPSMKASGWDGLSGMLGLGGISDLGKNIGLVMAMLPEMLIGMFTGKAKNLQFKDNLLPIAAIMTGLFFGKRNPMLKLLLVGLGGANLLNKAGHEILQEAGVTESRSQTIRQYRRYDDERLDPRIKDVGMKGNTMLATIDGVPNVITVSEDAVDAYYKGAVPLNTLANAVLKAYDQQKQEIGNTYARGMAESEDLARTVGLK